MLEVMRLWRDVAALAVRRAARAWPAAFSLCAYAAIMVAAASVLAPLGIVGGFIAGLIGAACVSSYLHLVAQAVTGSRLTWADFKQGFGRHFWDVVLVGFALWILSIVIGLVASAAGPRGAFVHAAAGITMAVLFNPAPEMIYQGRSRSFALLAAAARFVHEHPFEWLLPNLAIALALAAPSGALMVDHPGELVLLLADLLWFVGGLRIFGGPPWQWPLLLLGIHFAVVFRGLLFSELASGNARLRAFRRRMQS